MNSKSNQNQVFLFTFFNVFSMLIGFLATTFLYGENLDFLGKIRYVESGAFILTPLLVLGSANALVHYNSLLDASGRIQIFQKGIRTILVFWVLLFLLALFFYVFQWHKNFDYLIYSVPLALFMAFILLFKKQALNVGKLAWPSMFEKILPKLILALLFWLFIKKYISEQDGLLLFIFGFLLTAVGVFFYLGAYFKPVLSGPAVKPLFSKISKKEYYSYCLYSFLGSFGSFFALRIDSLMIPELLTFNDNGTYNIGIAMAALLAIPSIGVFSINSPLVSQYVKSVQVQKLKTQYQKQAINLLFATALVYGVVVLVVSDVFSLFPLAEKLNPSLPIIYILGINVLLNSTASFSLEIIGYSKYYRYSVFSVVLLGVLNFSLNYWVLTYTTYGIIGVAFASLASTFIFTLFKVLFIYAKFGILPYNKRFIKLLSIVVLVPVLIYMLVPKMNVLAQIVLKPCLSISIILILVFKLKLVDVFTSLCNHCWAKLKNK